MAMLLVAAASSAIGAGVASAAGAAAGATFLGMTGAGWGWMIGSLIGSQLFSEGGKDGPRISDGKFSSEIYGQPIPLNFGTMRHGAFVAWWSGLREASEEVGGKGSRDGTTIYTYSCDVLLSACEGPQAAVLRVWGNGRLLWQADGSPDGVTDESIIAAGNVRVYLGEEDQEPDPTYQAAVGAGNAPAYRGQVMVAIDDMQLEWCGNRPPTFEIEVTSNAEVTPASCPLDPVRATAVQQPGLFLAPHHYLQGQASSAAAYNASANRMYVVTSGADNLNKQIETYDLAGDAPAFVEAHEIEDWNLDSQINFHSVAWDPVNKLVRVLGNHPFTPSKPPAGIAIEYILDVKTEIAALMWSAAKFTWGWADLPTYGSYPLDGGLGGAGGRYGVIQSIYGTEGSPAGETGWWITGTAIIQYRLAHLMNGDGQLGWYNQSSDGRNNYTNDVLYVPPDTGLIGGGDYNFAWRYRDFEGYRDSNATVTAISGSGAGPDGGSVLVYAPSRKKLYIVSHLHGIAAIDLSFDNGDSEALSMPLTAYPTTEGWAEVRNTMGDTFAVWNNESDGLVLGLSSFEGLTMSLVDPDTMELIVGPCNYPDVLGVRAPSDMGDGRFCCVYGETQVAIIQMPGGASSVIGGPVTLRSIVEALCERATLPEANLNAAEGTDLVLGFKVARQTSARAAIEQLRPAYAFDMPESGSQLVLRKRGGNPLLTVDIEDMGAVEGTPDEPPAEYMLEHVDQIEAPRVVEVVYVDAGADYDPGVQRAERQTGTALAPLQLEVPVSLTADDARRVAYWNLLHAHSAKNPIKFSLPHKYERLTGADPILVPLRAGVLKRVRIDQILHARPMLEIQGVLEEQGIYLADPTGVPRYVGPQQLTLGGLVDTRLVLLDVPPLRDADNALVVYVAMSRFTETGVWPGASLYKSLDAGSSYSSVISTSAAASQGYAPTALGDWAFGNRWDNVNALDVVLLEGTLSSASDAAVLNGANGIAVQALGDDWELVQFATATLIGDRTWRLTRLLRGRKGTERCIAHHADGDRVVVLNENLRIVEPPAGEIGSELLHKGVTSGQAVSDADAQEFTLMGRSLMPLAPVYVQAVREADNTITLSWFRRVRIASNWQWNGDDLPLDETTEAYEVEILNADGDVARTISATTTVISYSTAQQLTDHGDYPTALTLRVYQISSRVGRGWPGVGVLTDLALYSAEPGVPGPGGTPGGPGDGEGEPGVVVPVVAVANRLLGLPTWFDGTWYTAPDNETHAIDLGVNGDQYVGASALKWLAASYPQMEYVPAEANYNGFYRINRTNPNALLHLDMDGDVLASAFQAGGLLTERSNIQWWSPSWTGPKIARRGMPGAGEANWYTESLAARYGIAANSGLTIIDGATDGTTWAFVVRDSLRPASILLTTDYTTFAEIPSMPLVSLPGGVAFSALTALHLFHNGSEWVLIYGNAVGASKLCTTTDFVTFNAEADPPWTGPLLNYKPQSMARLGSDYFYFHDHPVYGFAIYKSADFVSWTLAYTPTETPRSGTGDNAVLRSVWLAAGRLERLCDDKVVGTTDGTTWYETTRVYDGLEEMSRGVAAPWRAQTLPAELMFASQGTAGQGGALFTLNSLLDATPDITYQPTTTFGAGTVISGSATIGTILEGGKVGRDMSTLVKVLKAHASGQRYFEVRVEGGLSALGSTDRALLNASLRIGLDRSNRSYAAGGGIRDGTPGAEYVLWGAGPTLKDGDVVGIAADIDAGTIRMWINGVAFTPRLASFGEVTIPMTTGLAVHTVYVGVNNGVDVRIKARAADLDYPLPAGYTAWSD